MEPQKRFDRVIELARLLCAENNMLRFVILGTGPLREQLQEQIDAANLKEYVHLGKFVRDFAHIAGDADLFLMTSDNEGSPNALMEAMAAGVCCLSTSVGSVPQLFGAEFQENTFKAESLEDAAAKILNFTKDGEARKRIGQEMKERVLGQFSFEKSMRDYENLLAQLCLGR